MLAVPENSKNNRTAHRNTGAPRSFDDFFADFGPPGVFGKEFSQNFDRMFQEMEQHMQRAMQSFERPRRVRQSSPRSVERLQTDYYQPRRPIRRVVDDNRRGDFIPSNWRAENQPVRRFNDIQPTVPTGRVEPPPARRPTNNQQPQRTQPQRPQVQRTRPQPQRTQPQRAQPQRPQPEKAPPSPGILT